MYVYLLKGNGQKREYPVLFRPKTDVSETNSGRECCWPYLVGQHPLSPVFGQKRAGTPGNGYFAQLPPVFGHFMFLSGGLFDCSNTSTWATRTITPARTITRTSTVRQGDAQIALEVASSLDEGVTAELCGGH